MASRSETKIVCECGHGGILHCKENDAPFTKGYEEYRLSGFNGDTASFEGFCKDPTALLADLKPVCPVCGVMGKISYAPK